MTTQRWAISLLLMLALPSLMGCASSPPPQTPKALPIPASCPLSKVKPDMGMKEVTDILGQPTDTENYITGKQFAPFYFGGDTGRVKFHYKALGRITFTRSSAFNFDFRVMEDGVEYDPSESGYK